MTTSFGSFLTRSLCVGILVGVSSSLIAASPVAVLAKKDFQTQKKKQAVLFEDSDFVVVREAAATEQQFADLYVVHTPYFFSWDERIAPESKLVTFVPGRFAVVQASSEQAEKLAGVFHHSVACGPLVKLFGDSIIARNEQAAVMPVYATSEMRKDVTGLVNQIDVENIKKTITQLSTIETRYHKSSTGQDVPFKLKEWYEQLAGNRSDVSISVYDHGRNTPQKSVLIRIEGQSKPNEIVVLGSHLDSINQGDSFGRSPGADDNASGTSTNLEVFRVLMEQNITFERTVEIHAYAAEEIGLVGSQDIANDYASADKDVVSMMQLDMTLWRPTSAEDKIFLVSNNTSKDFNSQLKQLIDGYVKLAWEEKALYFGTSDHQSWHRKGFAAAFPFENPTSYNSAIHTKNDQIERVTSWGQAAGFGKLAVAYLGHFAGLKAASH